MNLVSICIPTFNGAEFIAKAMESAICQTYLNLEIIVSDDASKDDTIAIIESYRNKTSIPIHVFHHTPNGIGSNWNNCINKANGTYIKFLFQDDILLTTCIDEMVKVIENDKSFGMIASKRDFIVEESFVSNKLKKWIDIYGDLQEKLKLTSKDGLTIIDKTLFKSIEFFKMPFNKIGEPSVFLFRKDIVDQIGYFRVDLKQSLDYEFCYRILKEKKIAILDKKLVKFRLHIRQATNVNRENINTDSEIYSEILFLKFFWLLNNKTKIHLLEKHNTLFGYFMAFLRKLKLV